MTTNSDPYDPAMDDVVRDGMHWYWDLDGQPCSPRTWSRLFGDPEMRIVRVTVIPGRALRVVTAYEGSNFGQPLPALARPGWLYGTIVMPAGLGEVGSPSRELALAAHEHMVEVLMTGADLLDLPPSVAAE